MGGGFVVRHDEHLLFRERIITLLKLMGKCFGEEEVQAMPSVMTQKYEISDFLIRMFWPWNTHRHYSLTPTGKKRVMFHTAREIVCLGGYKVLLIVFV